ncbi:tripartite tricarboxylate transporter substrate binding protein [Pigmentiphaga sp.]|uniref:Bug family tripartite tricarboxylate transporter substrate binding protein n=1 Tax=Pigmentiphaga sp. TaxID=1977564 RepID=UPI0025DC093E|nr:tripartite tricarboxylate transporter substrate binding protein [Pigmentiphaga sp.]MBX6319565.1 tripartite tricarboxylate transporter substrate binding protein [Pigmentiphaga sp.]
MHKLCQVLTSLVAALGAAVYPAGHAIAQDSGWPKGVVKIVVPFPPGGTTDQIARLLADHFSQTFNERFVVENRAGANTIIGTEAVVKSRADGQTLLLTTAPYSIVAALYSNLPYDPLKDLVPVVRIAENPMLLVASPSAPAKTIQEMLRVSRERPGSLLVATVGTTGTSSMSNELFSAMAGITTTPVPYKGTGAIISDLVGGTVHYLFDNPSSSIPLVKSGKLRAVALTGKARSPALPDIPTVAESGLPGFETVNWYGIFAPANTPDDITARLNDAVNAFIKRPDIAQRLRQDVVDVVGGTRQEFADFLRKEISTWSRIAKERNIKPE